MSTLGLSITSSKLGSSFPPLQRSSVSNATGTDKTNGFSLTRTSDIFGSHVKSDLESNLNLIRRKIQEKFSSLHELVHYIRSIKASDRMHVTPTEFRFALIKFGIILPQAMIDKVFDVFDKNHTGMVNIDDFAVWIMNSEFKTSQAAKTDKIGVKLHDIYDSTRQKLISRPNSFVYSNGEVTFMDFMSEALKSGISDQDARLVYLAFDNNKTGYVERARLLEWLKSGRISQRISTPTEQSTATKKISLREILSRLGDRADQFGTCFTHIPHGQGIVLSLDEFRSCLIAKGYGKDIKDVKLLFKYFGNESFLEIDRLRNQLSIHPDNAPATSESLSTRMISTSLTISRAERQLRESVRKSYGPLKAELEAADSRNTGYIESKHLYRILYSMCTPISYHDYRVILQKLKTTSGESAVDWHNFLNIFNPTTAPHLLGTMPPRVNPSPIRTVPTISNSDDPKSASHHVSHLKNVNEAFSAVFHRELPKVDPKSMSNSRLLRAKVSEIDENRKHAQTSVAFDSSVHHHTAKEDQELLQKHSAVLPICSVVFKSLSSVWREFSACLRKSQVPTHRGFIVNQVFCDILVEHGLILSKNDIGAVMREFRAVGMQDVMRYDEFLRVCILAKNKTD